jgi:glycogen synthase
VLYQTPELLAAMRHNGMTADFSWSRTTEAYTKVFQRALS